MKAGSAQRYYQYSTTGITILFLNEGQIRKVRVVMNIILIY